MLTNVEQWIQYTCFLLQAVNKNSFTLAGLVV
jgi:hypothetical protein